MDSQIIFRHSNQQKYQIPASGTKIGLARQANRFVEPYKQEWAIIYNQQAEQYKRQKQIQKNQYKLKQQQLRLHLQKQLAGKSNTYLNDVQQDKKYSQYIKSQVRQQDQKQRNQRLQKLLERKRIENENVNKLQRTKQNSQAIENKNSAVGLEIGQKASKSDKKLQNYYKQKQLTDALDKQITIKQQQRKHQRQNEHRIEMQNQKYLNNYYSKRQSISPRRRQNQQVYEQFQKINIQNMNRQRLLQQKLVQQAMVQKRQKQNKMIQEKQMKKQRQQEYFKQVLNEQIKYRSQQQINNKKYNPEENSYQVLGDVFKNKRVTYDKKQYFDYLAKQSQQQSKRKRSWDYMDEREYRLNLNQLSKAITGNYGYKNYIDRSVNSIGQSKAKSISSMSLDLTNKNINDQKQYSVVKSKIDQIKHKERPDTKNQSYQI